MGHGAKQLDYLDWKASLLGNIEQSRSTNAKGAGFVDLTPLPELASVPWRPLVDERDLRRRGSLWTLTTVAHVVPFVAVGIVLVLLQPLAVAVSVIALIKAWLIPELYAQRGANVVRARTPGRGARR